MAMLQRVSAHWSVSSGGAMGSVDSVEMSRADLLWERDAARAKVARLQDENEHLRMLLGYAEAAMREEYRLRVASLNGESQL